MNTAKSFKFDKASNDMEKATQAFLKGNTGTYGPYAVSLDSLTYRVVVDDEYRVNRWNTDDELKDRRNIKRLKDAAEAGQIQITSEDTDNGKLYGIKYRAVVADTIAIRLKNGHMIGNSSVLKYVGRRMAFGNEVLNREETSAQRYISRYIPMIPFTVFKEAKLNIQTFETVDKGPAEIITRKRVKIDSKGKKRVTDETVHFTGASLFRVSGKLYLFDIDRREVKEKIFNPFLVAIPNQECKTIAAAYDCLMPKEVKSALAKDLKVLRQGEWFFIPTSVPAKVLSTVKVFGKDTDAKKDHWQRETMRLAAGNNRPNYAQTGFTHKDVAYVTGKVEHSGREHADLILKGWHVAMPNTATESFTITGDVD